MSVLKIAVLRQVAYAKSVRDVIRAILRRMLDGDWINHVFASSDEEFNKKLDQAFVALDIMTATKDDYCRAVAEVLCGEVSRLCMVLKDVCEGSGYGDYFESHISHERFVRLVLSTDTVKLGRMKKVLERPELGLIDVLRGVGAVLNDEPSEERAALAARERRRADSEIRSIAKATMKAIDAVGEKVDAVGAKVDEIGEKVARRNCRGKRRGKYDDIGDRCLRIWEEAQTNATLRNSLNTRITYKAVLERHKTELVSLGVGTVEKFRKVIHAAQSKRSSKSIKALEAARTCASSTRSGASTARTCAQSARTCA